MKQVGFRQSMYKHLKIQRQGYYQWCKRDNDLDINMIDMILEEVIKIRMKQSKVGVKKLHKVLTSRLQFKMIGRDRFIELLKEKGLMVNKAPRKKSFNYSSAASENYAHYSMNDIEVESAGQVIASDITYLPKGASGHFYLHLCVDLHSRAIVGWNLSRSLDAQYSVLALKDGIKTLKSHNCYNDCWVHHSDRGCQYNSQLYCKFVEKNKGYRSMTIGGAPYQNAIVERINGILKQELLPRVITENFNHALRIVKNAIETYNNERLHWSLNLETPMSKLTG